MPCVPTTGGGGSEALRRQAVEALGTPDAIKQRVYGATNPVSEVAGFAPSVAEVARGGDLVAAEIWADAAGELATTATTSLGRVFAPDTLVTVSRTGSLFNAHDLLLEPFERHVAEMWPAARLPAPKGVATDGARLLAESDHPPMFGSLIRAS